MRNNVKRNLFFLLIILTLASAILACGSGNNAEATAQAINEVFSKTATAAASVDDGPDTALLTAQVEATEQAEVSKVTQVAVSEANTEAQQATAAAEAPVVGELKLYGVDTEKGHVAWIHSPKTLAVDGYMAFDYANDYPEIIAKDFVISAEITWNTQYGSSGCGYMLRANGDQNKPDQYMALITRGGNGHLIFAIMEDGEPVGGYDIFPRTNDRSFDAHNDTTNRVAVVGQGGVFTFFTNGTWVGEVDLNEPPPQPVMPPKPQIPDDQSDNELMKQYRAQLEEYEKLVEDINDNYDTLLIRHEQESPIFEEGFVGLALASESGETTCHFENAWLWIIEE
jgi:hypothetical protein